MAKRMTNKEKKAKVEAKKLLQAEGILPPDKPRLNRKKFIDEALKEWDDREYDIYEPYLVRAILWMTTKKTPDSHIHAEAVAAAKVLKLAVKLREFNSEIKADGKTEYKLNDQYEYIKEILEA